MNLLTILKNFVSGGWPALLAAVICAIFGYEQGYGDAWEKACLEMDAIRAKQAVTEQECERWQATAEAYQRDAEAQTENAKLCLEREAKAAQDAMERAAIVKRSKPRARSAEEKNKVVDDETRRCAIMRLNRPL